jgi:RND family efflux transporter MFP subunit
MNVLKPMPEMPEADDRVVLVGRDTALPPAIAPGAGRNTLRMFLVAALLLGGGVAFGMWRHSLAEAEVNATSEQPRGIVPAVRVTTVHANDGMTMALLPASTDAFEAANIMARISGYVAKRYVDIGDHKAEQLLAEISAPELDHQIAQAQATLALSEAALNQAKAKREIASVTWNRDSNLAGQGWITSQQADTERLNLRAQEAAVTVAQANIRAQQAQLEVLLQLKAYQRVVAPFDGIVTQRNIDNGSLVQADIAGGIAVFTVMHSDVIRVQAYVPQDQVSGLQKGVGAIVRVAEMPGVEFRGTVARVASALQPGTRTLLTEIDVPNHEGLLTPILRGRAADPAQDRIDNRPRGGGHLQSQRPERRRRG